MTQLETQLMASLQQLTDSHAMQVQQLNDALQQQGQHYEKQMSSLVEQVQTLSGVQRDQSAQIEQLTKHVITLIKTVAG